MNGLTSFLLQDDGTTSYLITVLDISELEFNKVTYTKFAINCEIK